jgi:hypothetical protein
MEEPVTASMWELAQDADGCLRVELERTLAKQALTSASDPQQTLEKSVAMSAFTGKADTASL